jgi:O-antigen/teichoic acid export membrane protein
MHQDPSDNSELLHIARGAGVVFIATLILQASAFAILTVAAFVLPVHEFATVTVMMSVQVLTVAAIDLGINTTMTKLYSETKDHHYIRSAQAWRTLVAASVCMMGIVTWSLYHPAIGLGMVLGGVLSQWNGYRATDIAQQAFRTFAVSSALFSSARLLFGFTALLVWRDGELVMIAMHLLPALLIIICCKREASFSALPRAFATFRQFSNYALPVHIGQLAHVAVLYMPVHLAEKTLSTADVGALGLILTFCAPIPLFINAIRSTLLPRLLSASPAFEDWLWGWRGFLAVTLLTFMLISAGLVAAGLLNIIYGDKYPNVGAPFLIYFAGVALSGTLGLFSVSVHTQGVPQIAALVHCVKAALLSTLWFFFHGSLPQILWTVTICLIIGELVMIFLLHRKRSKVG